MYSAQHVTSTDTKLKHATSLPDYIGLLSNMKDNSDETVKVAEALKQKHQPSNKATVHASISGMETFDKSNFKSE